jgi:hypothetical protein
MFRRFLGPCLLILATGVFAVGCGGDDNDSSSGGAAATQTQPAETESESESGGESEGSKLACKGDAIKDTGLPAAFPVPGELTFTETQKDGPTTVVDGYWAAGIDEAYPEFKDQVEQAGYKILFTEKEKNDAEISYSGSGRTGQIALRADCSEPDTTRVHITNRPA